MNEHLSDHQVLDYLEDDLSPRRRERVEAHLSACPACHARLERLSQAAVDLTVTLRAVGEQVPLAPARSWEAVTRRRRERRPPPLATLLQPPLRLAATLAVLALVVGLAGLVHTLATAGLPSDEPTPTPHTSPQVSPSSPPGPLPRPRLDRLTGPVTLLILGADGESATSDETDTLVLLYLDAEAGRAFLLHVPRDLYVDVPGHGQARAGSIYGIGRREETADGLSLARETISGTLGLPVRYAALVRFDAFVGLIDAIGGLDVEVPHTIEDSEFPDGRGGYDPLFIPAGRRHFDGALALRYARTRVVPASGFDRAFRQQQLILAAQERVVRSDLLPDLIAQAPAIWSTVADGLETDLSLSEAIDLALLAKGLTSDDVATVALDECCTVEHTTSAGRRVLLPRPEEIETLMADLLEDERR